MDWASGAERISPAVFNNGAMIINSWAPDQLRGVSDFDARHQINSNWVWELPFGRGRRFVSSTKSFVNALIGGWQLAGLFRWTSGYPFGVDNDGSWPTNWDVEGWATLSGEIPPESVARGNGPNAFKDPAGVLGAFRRPYPGESGTRNPLRGDGYFGIDTGLSKSFPLGEKRRIQFRWETFNITNSVRFDVGGMSSNISIPDSFGSYNSTLTTPRVMQFALRFEF